MDLVTVKRIRGLHLIVLCRTLDGAHCMISTTVNLWRPHKRRREIGGSVPKPFRKHAHAKVRKLPRPGPPDEVG